MTTAPVKHLRVGRYFSQRGVDPLDTVTYERRSTSIKGNDGGVVFSMDDIEAPESWSQHATDIAASKYFRKAGVPGRGNEHSVRQLVSRVANAIAQAGVAQGYFGADDAAVFRDELAYLLIHQMMAFNSPVWFNCGVYEAYGVKGDPSGSFIVNGGQVEEAESSYERPTVSACFIQNIQDDLMDILEHAKREARIFKFGSGAGANYSNLRGRGEPLSNGGTSSGMMSFLRIFDTAAGAIKSGGTCLAPDQRVFTNRGPTSVKELAESGRDFVTLSYDPPAGRYKAKMARAWLAGEKRVVEVTTDKGKFRLSFDHPMRLADHATCMAGDLKPGMSLLACAVDRQGGYLRVHLRNGNKGKERFHRMIAADVMGYDLEDRIVHHDDEDKDNNEIDNLLVWTQAEHAAHHMAKLMEAGEHPFQQEDCPHATGADNGMHRDAAFWQDEERADAYRAKQSSLMTSTRAAAQQKSAARQRMMNLAYRIVNAGLPIDTFDDYYAGRKAVATHGGKSKGQLLDAIERRFGSYGEFVRAVRDGNHKVLSVADVAVMPVYNVEVDCPTADDKTHRSGHNFVIWSDDDPVGRGVVVYNTRRAAKIIVVDADHPDVEEFVQWKVKEEDKAKALIAAGYDADFNGDAYQTISGQNANNSIGCSDAFMQAAVDDRDWDLIGRVTGKPLKIIKARKLLDDIAQAAWNCADPGLQYAGTLNRWHTCKASGPIRASNPCAEYVFLDESACNLASVNLVKFSDDGAFHVQDFQRACRITFLAQEILVDYASYPTAEIARNSHDYRTLGLGYSNLGALLMRSKLAYDSPEARTMAAAITSLMTATAYALSAEVAEVKGPFAGFAHNREHMLEVMLMHASAASAVSPDLPGGNEFLGGEHARTWARAIELGRKHGFRNAQATLLAPTGTISFLMDCDTTGVEPDYMLVKYKKLAGGGTMKIVNQSVDYALGQLGYSQVDRDDIVDYLLEHHKMEGAPRLRPQHLPIFDCATRCGDGERFISPDGHIAMMAAVQPFLSGAISKTVNLPNETTVEDIRGLYVRAWELGIKCLAVYRDGSKGCQVLGGEDKEPERAGPQRRRLPKKRGGFTQEARVGGQKLYLRTGEYEDGTLGEIFIDMHKEGATMRSMTNCFSIAISIAMQYGVPLSEFVDAFTFTSFAPNGMVQYHPNIKAASSIIDYVFRAVGLEYLGRTDLAHVLPDCEEVREQVQRSPHVERGGGSEGDSKACGTCGMLAFRNGGTCYVCGNCGTQTGCG